MPRGVGPHVRIPVCLVLLIATAVPAFAQDSPPRQHPGSTRDFMFGRPRGSVSVRGGWVLQRAGSDLYDFVADQLTLEKSDFNTPAVGAEVGFALGSRVEVLGGFEFSQSNSPSEYRRFVDNLNLPITQSTRLRQVHAIGSVKVALTPRGQSLSRLAWVPRGVIPYVGGGGGAVHYDFRQSGDFVDFVDSSVFTDVFDSKGWAPTMHVFGGADVQMYRMLFLELEGRYQWAKATLGPDFIDFDRIDLSGFRMTAGVSILF